MYQPPAFREDRLDVQHALIRAFPLGLLVTAGSGGLVANPIPFLLDIEGSAHGTLLGHLARANGQLDDLAAAAECLVLFQGPQGYVTPSWYATKRDTGKVVPTWNYAVVQVRGRPRVVDDVAWLRAQVDRLTRAHEAHRAAPWAVDDAPAAFVTGQVKGIVGLEIPIERIEGKWKTSQNRSDADRAGVAQGFADAGETALSGLAAPLGRPAQ